MGEVRIGQYLYYYFNKPATCSDTLYVDVSKVKTVKLINYGWLKRLLSFHHIRGYLAITYKDGNKVRVSYTSKRSLYNDFTHLKWLMK